MADKTQKAWQDATHQILTRLDLIAEYKALGLDVCGSKPSSKGWVEARSYGIEDKTPSAGINIADGPVLGKYKDFRGETMGLFDFAAKVGRFPDWRAARNHYANQLGIALPSGEDEFVADRFDFSDLTFGTILVYAGGKPGVTAQSIRDVGGRYARWPKKLSAERTNYLISFPMYGEHLLEAEPVGWHSVHSNPRQMIRKYQGQGNPEQLLDKMTSGEYGLMNVDGLKLLAEAEVVNIVEGLTDLLATQAVLAEWRNADPENRKHVVLSAGGCTYHPKAEWMHHFAGKEVRVWFDVGDAKNEGQIGAQVWVKALLPVAGKVRNCQLPLGPEGGKNDVRAWLTAGHNYADMDIYALTFEPVVVTDDTAQLSEGDAILANIGITVVGEHEGKSMIEVFSESKRKGATIFDIDKLSINKLVQLIGSDVTDKYIYEGNECPPEKYDIKKVRKAIANAASGKFFFGDEKFGAGVWEHDGQIVLVKSQEIGILNGSGRVEQSHVPFSNGRMLDCGRASGDWYDIGTINRHLNEARDHKWCAGVIQEATEMFGMWNWRQVEHAPMLVTGLIICSWMQSIWKFRPQVFITGNSNTGKTILLQDTVSNGIFGPLGMFVEKPTEAAISQFMKHHSKVVFVDEFEKDSHRQKVLELFRTTSRGGVKIRGTADHRGIQFRLKHIPWLSAIETGLSREADKNRYIILELDAITPQKRADFEPRSQEYLAELGQKLLAIGLAHYQEARRLVKVLQDKTYEGVPSRCVESFSLPIAVLCAAIGADDATALVSAAQLMGGWDFEFQQGRDDVECLAAILQSQVDLPRGEKVNVSTLIRRPDHSDNKDAMNRVGVRMIRKYNHNPFHDGEFRSDLWICQDVAVRMLLKNTKYEDHNIDQYLMRLGGAKRSRQRLGGEERFYGVEIPMSTVDEVFKSMDEDQDTEDGGLS